MFSSNISARLSFLHFKAPHLAEYIRRLCVWWNRPASECQWLAECLYRMKSFRELILLSILVGLPTERRILAARAMPIFDASRLRKLALHDWDFAEDAYDLLGMLSPTLEELVLENIRTENIEMENIEMETPPTTHFEGYAENIIECRRLQYLELQWLRDTHSWNMPPWIPVSSSEFALIMKITLFGSYGRFPGLFTWIKDCIDRLPFPNLIKVFSICIQKSFSTRTGVDGFLPETSDYEMLSRFLQPLWKDGVLENFALTIIIDGDHDVAPDSARESVKLDTAFAGLLPANVSDVRFIVRPEGWRVMHCATNSLSSPKISARFWGEQGHRDPPTLPVEIISEIIAIVASEDSKEPLPVVYKSDVEKEAFRTLAAASLVSHSWNAISRRHIFHSVFIPFNNTSARLSFLHFQAPHLAEYIHRLCVWWDDGTPPVSEWLTECFCRLKNFRELILTSSLSGLLTERRISAVGVMPVLAASRLRTLTLRHWGFAEDAYDLLGMLPPTLEELVLEDIHTETIEIEAPPPTTHLADLRRLVLIDTAHPMLSAENIIECPHLKQLELYWLYNVVDSWGGAGCLLPNFGKTIRPSVVTITLWSNGHSFRDLFTWIKDCIDRLPFPNLIQVLKIHIQKFSDVRAGGDPLPQILDYEMLSQALQPLCKNGALTSITLDISTDGNHDVGTYSARESAKVKAGLAGLLPANISDPRFIMDRTQFSTWTHRDGGFDMRCIIQIL
ncbi:hypothetical protein PC9H_005691 [Pleurotus ostreatus]|uniref:F-box domain-containing protein n=1 Tax=Pleurotus ostreatus TaxID=5322 RepID=A0A8H7A002_PLEOS|nr:uncharacterized protein PC9H_005691 [Pleurotus ostreatus]KAF7433726.1 hypothetical protein PC9H_005691 [Pleurotus ostreatus]